MGTAYVGLLLYFLVYFLRPEDWIPGTASIPLSVMAGAVAVLGCVVSVISTGRLPKLPSEMILIVLLWCDLCLATGFSIWPGGSFQVVSSLFGPILILLVIVTACTTLARVTRLIWVHTICIAAVAIVSVLSYRQGRLSAVVDGDFGNPNELALSICLIVPFCLTFAFRHRRLYQSLFWLAVTAAMSYAVILTYSRGGMIVLAIIMAAMIWNLGIRAQRRAALFLLPVMLVGFAVYAPGDYSERMATIANPEKDGSAADRQIVFNRSLKTTLDHPLFGVGPGMFLLVSGKWIGTHNTYTQLSSEAGIPALLLFLLILICAFSNLRHARKSNVEEIRLLANAVQASLLGLIVAGWFVHAAYHTYVYFLIAYTSVLYRLARTDEADGSLRMPAPISGGIPRWQNIVTTLPEPIQRIIGTR